MSYSELTRRYFESAPNAGALEGADVLHGEAGSRSLGTWVRFDVQVGGASPVATVLAARFRAFGCPHVIAAAAWVAEQAPGRPADARLPESVEALRERFAVPVEKTGRLLIVEDAWSAALKSAGQQSGHPQQPS